MLKYFDVAETLSEFPDEITLCINITQCPCKCENCSEPWLQKDQGTELTKDKLVELVEKHPYCSCIGFMGGDINHEEIKELALFIKEKYHLKVGFYSGFEFINLDLVEALDYYKIGKWKTPKGDMKEWHKTTNGPLQFPWSNQLFFEIHDKKLINATEKFRRKFPNNLEHFIIEGEDEDNFES